MPDDAEILVVDDIPTNLEIVMESLSSEGYAVSVVTSGERALKHLQTYVPDLILLDVKMPGMDGFATCQRIKANEQTANIPIIFITALSDTESITQGFSLGAVDYISKPFQEAELLARVKNHLKLQVLNQSLEQQVTERTCELEAAVTQLQDALTQLKLSQLRLVQHEKMSTLGNLVAGIAHEINNPIGFLDGNIDELKLSFQNITSYITLYETAFPSPGNELKEKRTELDIEFLLEDLPKMLNSMASGCDRIRNISNSLRCFARDDTNSKFETNIHEALDGTLVILKYRLKGNEKRPEIDVIRDYSSELPEILCFPGQISQVFMNILANAIDMFDELAEIRSFDQLQAEPQQITIYTQQTDSQHITIGIRDNGKGMSQDVCSKIFDRQFTTKVVGKGTGLGLAIAHQVVVDKHGGQLEVKSDLGQGTEFLIRLPI